MGGDEGVRDSSKSRRGLDSKSISQSLGDDDGLWRVPKVDSGTHMAARASCPVACRAGVSIDTTRKAAALVSCLGIESRKGVDQPGAA